MTGATVQGSAEAPHLAEELWVPGLAAMAMEGLEEHLFRGQ